MGDVTKFPASSMAMIPVDNLPPGTRYKCEAPDWIVRKTTDDGSTWSEIGRLDPPHRSSVAEMLAPAFEQIAERTGRTVTEAEREAMFVAYYRDGIDGVATFAALLARSAGAHAESCPLVSIHDDPAGCTCGLQKVTV